MFTRLATAVSLVLLTLSQSTWAQNVITITTHRSVCSAVYTSASTTVTVIKSTVTVTPSAGSGSLSSSPPAATPSDAALNAGTPFSIELAPGTWLTLNGSTTNDVLQAAQYIIRNGGLYSATTGLQVSANPTDTTVSLAPSAAVGSITCCFSFVNGTLTWTNPAFANGNATFYASKLGPGASVVASLIGSQPAGYVKVVIRAAPPAGSYAASSTAVGTMSVSTSYIMQSMSSAAPPPASSGTAGAPGGYTPPPPAGYSSTPGGAGSSSQGAPTFVYSPPAAASTTSTSAGAPGGYSSPAAPSSPRASSSSAAASVPVGYSVTSASSSMSTSSSVNTLSTVSAPGTPIGPDNPGGYPRSSTSSSAMMSSSMPVAYTSPAASSSRATASTSTVTLVSATSSTSPGGPYLPTEGTVYVPTPSFSSSRASSSSTPGGQIATEYSNQAPGPSSPVVAASSSSSRSSINTLPTYTSNGVPIGPDNPGYGGSTTLSSSSSVAVPPIYGPTTTTTSSSSSSMMVPPIYGPTTTTSSSSSVGVPPIYGPTTTSTTSSSRASSSSSSPLAVPPIYGPTTTTTTSVITSSSSSSLNIPPIYGPTTTSTTSSSALRSSSTSSPVFGTGDIMTSSSQPYLTPYSSAASSTSTGAPPSSTIPACPSGNNTLFYDSNGATYRLLCDLDSNPASYSNTAGPNLQGCLGLCDADTQCAAVAFNGQVLYGGTCYFKRSVQTYSSSPGLYFALLVSPAPAGGMSSSKTSSTMMGSSTSSRVTVMGPTITTASAVSTMPMSSSSSVAPAATATGTNAFSCAANNGQTITDAAGIQYVISCNSEASTGNYASSSATTSFNDCFNSCDTNFQASPGTNCTAFTFFGGNNGVGSGTCFLKNGVSETFIPGNAQLVGVIKAANFAGFPTTSARPTTTTTTTSRSSTSSSLITTAPSSSRASSSSTSSMTATTPYLVLPSPTACDFGDPPNYDEDDSYCEVDLPFAVQIYGTSSRNTYASTNGFISLITGSSQYSARALPASNIPNNTVLPFWDDLFMYGPPPTGTGVAGASKQGIWYQIQGTAVVWEYYVARGGDATSIYHFTVAYDSNVPGTWRFKYYSVGTSSSDMGVNGATAAVGMQGFTAGGSESSTQYSFRGNPNAITSGSMLTCSGTTNRCTAGSPSLVTVSIG